MQININFKKLTIVGIGIVIAILIGVFIPVALISLIIGGIIGFYVQPRFKDIIEWLKDVF